MTRRSILLALLLPLSGCRVFRAEVGVGLGIGADVHLSGLVHTGLLASAWIGGGNVYGESVGPFNGALTVPGFHTSDSGFKTDSMSHSNLGVLPPLTAGISGRERLAHPWAFEVTAALLFVTIRVGLDPIGAILAALDDPPEEVAPPPPRPSPPKPEPPPPPPPPLPRATSQSDDYFRVPTTPERARSARIWLTHAVGLYASWGDPCLDPSWKERRARLGVTIRGAIAACEDQGDTIDLFELSAWAHAVLRRHRWCDPAMEADDVARELLPRPRPDRRAARPDPWLPAPERRLGPDASAARARTYLAEAVAEYALGTGAAFEIERPARKDRIQRAAWVCANAGEPVAIDELTAWARSRLEGDDADAWATTVARELARHCGVAPRTIR